MSFGKNDQQLGGIPTHGATMSQAGAYNKKPTTRRSGGGSRGLYYWTDTFRPQDNIVDTIRLVPGAYTQKLALNNMDGEAYVVEDTLPYVCYREHHNGKQGCICSAGPLWTSKTDAAPCPSCTVFWEDWRERRDKKTRGDKTPGPNRISCVDRYAFNVWDYGIYFEMPQLDKNGQPRMNAKTGQPYTRWEKGNVNDPKYAGRQWTAGRLIPWIMNESFRAVLVARGTQIGAHCRSCCTTNSVTSLARVCGTCRNPIYDPNNHVLTPEQQQKIDTEHYACPNCQQVGFTTEVLACTSCDNPQRATIFDVDMQVQRLVVGDRKYQLEILAFSEPRPPQVSPEVLPQLTPPDLLKRFAPTPPDVQIKVFNLQPAPPVLQAGAAPMAGIPQQAGYPQQPPAQAAYPQQAYPQQPQAAYPPQGYQPPQPQQPAYQQQPVQQQGYAPQPAPQVAPQPAPMPWPTAAPQYPVK